MEYLVVKWLHILSSTVLFGTGIGSAFYLLTAALARNTAVVAHVSRWVVRADWLFTATTAVLQPLTGWWLMHLAGLPHGTSWIACSIGLYAVAMACWLPVVWLQIRMRDLAFQASERDESLPPAFWRCFGWWVALGVPALVAFLAVFWLMVAKPA
ncbi:DUF2269 domain-containing protein [Acidovorax sp. LjRoot129]|uniref:DUF2269 family protein n=1 Tax=Acidovorax sp. LjRoot129 TaxID=3342260 RepID=UPI003ECF014C